MRRHHGQAMVKYAGALGLVFLAGCFATPIKDTPGSSSAGAGSLASSFADTSSGGTGGTASGGAKGSSAGGTSARTSGGASAGGTTAVSAGGTSASSAGGTGGAEIGGTSGTAPSTSTSAVGAKLGEACGTTVTCSEGTCVSGLCCDKPCTDGCYSCIAAETGKSDGTCAPVKVDTNPKGTCKLDTANPCGELAACDGLGACKKAPASKVCKAAGCDNGYYNAESSCDGAGVCKVTPKACGAYACTTTGCKTSCASSSDCTGNNTCDANKTCSVPAACVPKARDCTSTADNNCNGSPDNQESACACKVNETQACQTHQGLDGKGICKAGSQKCEVSTDKTTSAWGPCSGSVGPGTEVCDAALVDEDCDGQSNEGCQCVNGTTNNPCGSCGGVASCSSGVLGACSKNMSTFYRDYDNDGYGTTQQTRSECTAPQGYVANSTDCDDNDSQLKPGSPICSTPSEKKACGAANQPVSTPCPQGCLNGECRNDGTIGLPGWVTCGASAETMIKCQLGGGQGCNYDRSSSSPVPYCGGLVGSYQMYCDGPNDCAAGEVCCRHTIQIGVDYTCVAKECPVPAPNDYRNYYAQVCDPLQPVCPPGETCAGGGGTEPHWCQ